MPPRNYSPGVPCVWRLLKLIKCLISAAAFFPVSQTGMGHRRNFGQSAVFPQNCRSSQSMSGTCYPLFAPQGMKFLTNDTGFPALAGAPTLFDAPHSELGEPGTQPLDLQRHAQICGKAGQVFSRKCVRPCRPCIRREPGQGRRAPPAPCGSLVTASG